MRDQATTLPLRVPWNGFREVIVHSSIYKLKELPEYYAAKRGNDRAAARIAGTLVRPEKIDTAVDFVVRVIQVEGGHYIGWEDARTVQDGRVDGLILDQPEAAWLSACWNATHR